MLDGSRSADERIREKICEGGDVLGESAHGAAPVGRRLHSHKVFRLSNNCGVSQAPRGSGSRSRKKRERVNTSREKHLPAHSYLNFRL